MTERDPIDDLLHRASDAIAAGERHYAEAAAYLSEAQQKGATQRQIAEVIGKSAAWVNRLMQWHRDGCNGTPFGPQSKRARVQAAEHKKKKAKPATTGEQARAQTAKAHADRAKAEAQKAKAEAAKAKAEAQRARSENAKAQARARKAREEAFANMFGGGRREKKKVHTSARDILVKALGMLGSDQAGERDNAARIVEQQRKKLGMTWDELIVPADDVADTRAAA